MAGHGKAPGRETPALEKGQALFRVAYSKYGRGLQFIALPEQSGLLMLHLWMFCTSASERISTAKNGIETIWEPTYSLRGLALCFETGQGARHALDGQVEATRTCARDVKHFGECRARWDPTKVNDVTYTGELVPQQLPAQTAPIRITVLGSWWAALLLVCTTMMCLTSAFTAFILYVRPVLQRTERAALACEIAAQGMEEACEELEKASEVIHTDLPTTLNAVERTSLEFEELGRSLNMLSGPIKRAAVPALAVRAVGTNTGDGMRRIAQDVTSLTQALTPAMEGWRKRIGRIAANFEAANKVSEQSSSQAQPQARTRAGPESSSSQTSQQVQDASKEAGPKRQQDAYSGPHTVWNSFTELDGEAAAAKSDERVADALTQAIKREGGRDEEAAAALATQEMADAASGVMAEASRLASDIMTAESTASKNGDVSDTSSSPQEPEESAEVAKRRESAEAVFTALFKAQEAASAAARASGELETALKRAESHSWSDSAGADRAVLDAVEEVSRTVKITKGKQAASRGESVLGQR